MVIDFHAHVFPERIVARALESLQGHSGVKPCSDGTLEDLRRQNRAAGIDKSVILNIATNPKQQKNVNDFAISIQSEDIISFGSVHPFAPDAIEELHRIAEAGLPGIKLHPDFQNFYADDEKVYPIYETAAKLGLITVFHAGVDIGLFDPVHCNPKRLARILPVFDGAPVVAAHFGSAMLWFDVEKYLVGREIYLDTSYSYSRMPPGLARRIIETHGYHNILFGSDTPWSPPADEADYIRHLGLPPAAGAAILGGNAAKLLNL